MNLPVRHVRQRPRGSPHFQCIQPTTVASKNSIKALLRRPCYEKNCHWIYGHVTKMNASYAPWVTQHMTLTAVNMQRLSVSIFALFFHIRKSISRRMSPMNLSYSKWITLCIYLCLIDCLPLHKQPYSELLDEKRDWCQISHLNLFIWFSTAVMICVNVWWISFM